MISHWELNKVSHKPQMSRQAKIAFDKNLQQDGAKSKLPKIAIVEGLTQY